MIPSWGTASWAFTAVSWYSPFLLQVSLFPISSLQEKATSQSKIGEMVAPNGWSQMANASSCTLAAVTDLCFSPQTRNKQYYETLETSETTTKFFSPPTQHCQLCQICLPPPLKCNIHSWEAKSRESLAFSFSWMLLRQHYSPEMHLHGSLGHLGKSEKCVLKGM